MLILHFVDTQFFADTYFSPVKTFTGDMKDIQWFYYAFLHQNDRFKNIRCCDSADMSELQIPITDNMTPKK